METKMNHFGIKNHAQKSIQDIADGLSGSKSINHTAKDPYADVIITTNEMRMWASGKVFRPRSLL